MIKKLVMAASLLLSVSTVLSAQTVKSHDVEQSGSGPYKAQFCEDQTLPTHTIYRPIDLAKAVAKEGKLPVILYANGACFNNNVEMRLLLGELASYGYIVLAIGPYDENDTVEQWKSVLFNSYPEGKNIVFANGEKFTPPTEAERKAQEERRRKEMEEAQKNQTAPAAPAFRTYPRQLLEAMDWITDRNADPSSDYYHMIDLDHVAVMGQSCGGAQALAVAHDPRVKTCVILNSGMGEMSMQGADKNTLKNLHTPMFYLNGGPIDIAYENALGDYKRIENVPVALWYSQDGHNGTYYEKNGGPYAIAVRKWLDWQLKGHEESSAVFFDEAYAAFLFPGWNFTRKNM